MTPIQRLNYKYAALRWSISGTLTQAANILESLAYPGIAATVRETHWMIKQTLQAQYEHDKIVLQTKLNKTDKPT